MNATMYRLAIVATVFLPLGLLTGLLGINVGGIPGSDEPKAFALVSASLLALAVGEVIYFRRRRLL
jgi:zinc transporter